MSAPAGAPPNRLVLLDAGPLGLVTNPRESERSRRCNEWLRSLLAAGLRVVVPEVTDYEVRRELIRAGRPKGLARLDALAERVGLLLVDSATWRRAAELWAEARAAGRQAAADKALDADMILAAGAHLVATAGWEVLVATDNVGHLAHFVDARPWDQIAP